MLIRKTARMVQIVKRRGPDPNLGAFFVTPYLTKV